MMETPSEGCEASQRHVPGPVGDHGHLHRHRTQRQAGLDIVQALQGQLRVPIGRASGLSREVTQRVDHHVTTLSTTGYLCLMSRFLRESVA